MSTRANIIVKDGYDQLIFYRHSDGYPKGTLPLLQKFLGKVIDGEIRDNVIQSTGHLIILGKEEWDGYNLGNGYSWKVGTIEPTTEIHCDIEYLYTIDLENKTLEYKAV